MLDCVVTSFLDDPVVGLDSPFFTKAPCQIHAEPTHDHRLDGIGTLRFLVLLSLRWRVAVGNFSLMALAIAPVSAAITLGAEHDSASGSTKAAGRIFTR